MMQNKLRTIPSFSSYMVSASGAVFNNKLYKIKPHIGNRGYLSVKLREDIGKYRDMPVHLLVLSAFVEEKPSDKPLGLHIDDNKLNNNVGNLRWGTFQDNMDDRVRNGKQTQGEQVCTAKLTPKDVKEIRDLHKMMGYRRIAKLYEVAPNTIMYCIKRVSWKGVE